EEGEGGGGGEWGGGEGGRRSFLAKKDTCSCIYPNFVVPLWHIGTNFVRIIVNTPNHIKQYQTISNNIKQYQTISNN
ncbi:MAG: hypothetical protein IJ581_00435, partial [Paludibacteraceae bacterium]|nr:hypothetical protein [Paludibacteraceae bacterium]